MSSTGRKADRVADENYPTPSWPVRRLLEAVDLPGGNWVEPAVGEGAIVRAVNEVRKDVRWTTLDVRLVSPPVNGLDAIHAQGSFIHAPPVTINLGVLLTENVEVCLTNPPFSLARSFIERSEELMPNAWRIFLLRLNFLGSEDRHPWISRNMPDLILQLPNRPSFVRGKTDSIEYAWFAWKPGAVPRTTSEISILGLTSLEERKRG